MVSVRTIAAIFLVLGAGALAFPTLASEGFSTERPTSFSMGSNDNALLGSEETGHNVTNQGKGKAAVVGRLTNNFDSKITITYRVQTIDGSIEPDPQYDTVQLQPGESLDITVRCAPPGKGGGQGTAVVTTVVESAKTDGIAIEDAEFDFQVSYDCQTSKKGDKGGDDNEGDEDEGDEDNKDRGKDGKGDEDENGEDGKDRGKDGKGDEDENGEDGKDRGKDGEDDEDDS